VELFINVHKKCQQNNLLDTDVPYNRDILDLVKKKRNKAIQDDSGMQRTRSTCKVFLNVSCRHK
jgi:hypothetical protein